MSLRSQSSINVMRIIKEGRSELVNELIAANPWDTVEDAFYEGLDKNRVLKEGETIASWEASTLQLVGNLLLIFCSLLSSLTCR